MRGNTPQLVILALSQLSLLLSNCNAFSLATLSRLNKAAFFDLPSRANCHRLCMGSSAFEDDDEDEDDEIDVDALGDWRAFRRNLASSSSLGQETLTAPSTALPFAPPRKSVSRENEKLLESQNKELAAEYKSDLWAHPVSVPEVGGLVVRMPLEVEIFRNHKHSLTGRKLRKKHSQVNDGAEPAVWYHKAQSMVEAEMLLIAKKAGVDGQIDSSKLNDDSAELLQLYLDNQESWQSVCLVVDRNEETGKATTFVLNRPMALKLTENLARLVLHGVFMRTPSSTTTVRLFQDDDDDDDDDDDEIKMSPKADLLRFMLAFGQECAVYIGGPDDQHKPAEIIHGIPNLPGAREISPGSRIYRGGVDAAIDGVLRGKYNPMDFRFFVGKHKYEESALDVSIVLGKYQPIACARSLALKQCISLPKPLWHEVLELCDGELRDISQLEMLKRDDLRFQIVDDDDDENDIDELGLLDELDELDVFDDEDDE